MDRAKLSELMGAFRACFGKDACWNWPGGKGRGGYGLVKIDGRQGPVCRVVLSIVGRPCTESQVAMHTCDNPPCFNPDHLTPGTQKDNIHDMISKGRHAQLPNTGLCKRGHSNWRVRSDGTRGCRDCHQIHNKTHRLKSAAL